MKRGLLSAILIWLTIVGLSLFWNLSTVRKYEDTLAYATARALFDYIVITRKWNAEHGGVYVPVTSDTQPNTYLEVPMRDIQVGPELTLTMVNPAYMTRQISEIAEPTKGVKFHITSLKPLRPANKPTDWEAEALRSFAAGSEEYGMFVGSGEQQSFRYMAPLITEQACLNCHEHQGYKLGEVRGGISISIPQVPSLPSVPLLTGHFVIATVGIVAIVLFGMRLNRNFERLNRESVLDALTGIPNRRYFAERIVNELRRHRRDKTPLSVLMCDLDGFKAFNDKHGHQAGDRCLQQVAKLIKKTIQRPADFCARYGGEEFVVILPDTPLEGARRIAENLRQSVESTCLTHDPQCVSSGITISVGAATEVPADDSEQGLISKADRALYDAKRAGRNAVRVYVAEDSADATDDA